ncbi:30S ribosomal subunit protein S9 [Candidatus Hodgkinia cicadicola]|uniref:Small ribosomal subunit protein uS9 n=1 Tax=Candidatus Hodgkinia cicadicola TaxID=573658 RepID=A0ABX4MHE9_9HYPH|nr:30S ribosomal subunit protein S9 [Candidatus Hodgkinia cicadicola]
MYKTKVCNGWTYASAKKKTAIAKVKVCLNESFVLVINNPANDNHENDALFKYITHNVFNLIRYKNFQVFALVKGGGLTSQAYAIRLAMVKCLLCLNDGIRPVLKANNYISTDCRMVERKKCGHCKARKSCQFSKR